MNGLIPVRLRIEGTGQTKAAVIDALEYKARLFFGEEEFRVDGDITVSPDETSYANGQIVSRQWTGLADFINYRERT